MSRSADELRALLEQASHLPYGASRIALVEQVVRHADTLADPDLAFSARMHATTAYVYGGEPAKSFVSFSWCLSDFDRNPAPYHQRWTHNLLWHFKYMVSAMTKFPEIPLDRTYAVLDDMERRYREGGHSMQAVLKHRYLVADHIGDEDEAERLYAQWTTAARDDLSDCAGCDPTTKVNHLRWHGRDEEAVALAEPVLAGRLSCSEQPQSILEALTVPYLRTGRLEQAVDAHRRSYQRFRGNLADLWDIGDTIAFCARTGNEHRGLEILRRHVDWLAKAPTPAAGMHFAAGAGLLLRRLGELGYDDTEVTAGRTVAALRTELTEHATGLARRFDARNGTTARSEEIAEQLAAEPYDVVLPLSPTARPAPAQPARPAPRPAAVPADLSAAELVARAESQMQQDADEDMRATLAAFDQRFPDLDALAPEVAARRMRLRGDSRWTDDEDPAGAIEAWLRSAELFEAAGDPVEAGASRAQAGLGHCLLGAPDEGLPWLEQDVARHEGGGDQRRLANALSRWALAMARQDRLDEAIDAQRRAGVAAAAAGLPRKSAREALRLAGYLYAVQRGEEAQAAALSALTFYRESGPDALRAEAALRVGEAAPDFASGLEFFAEAVAHAGPELALQAHWAHGFSLMRLDRPAEALADLVEVVATSTERQEDGIGGIARLELARAYWRTGRFIEAAEVAEEAVVRLDRGDDPGAADEARFTLALAYRDLGSLPEALATYDELIARLDGNPAGRGQMRENSADVLYRMDRDAEAADRFGEAAEDLRAADDPLGEVRALRRRVLASRWADLPDQALETAARARELLAALPDEPPVIWEAASLDHETAAVLVRIDDEAGALDRLAGVADKFRTIGADANADEVDLFEAQLLVNLDRPADAEVVARRLWDRIDADHPLHRQTANLLGRALSDLGRKDEAIALWDS